jgi:nucleotidyltransferase substrate binding protein (TIGR01987 family)
VGHVVVVHPYGVLKQECYRTHPSAQNNVEALMSERPDLRWKQRYANLLQAHALLEEGLTRGIGNLNQLEREGLVQRFEDTFELTWKTLKDSLEASGIPLTISTPREVLKEAFAAGIITNGSLWLRMLDHRNLLSHTYDVKRFDEAVRAIDTEYAALIRVAVTFFAARGNE